MPTTIGIGVIGMGWMGQAHTRSYLQIPLRFPEGDIMPRLIICADNVEERADQAKAVLGFENSTTNWQKVIEHPDVKVVNITSPNNLHGELVSAAAAAGKHVFCEKPVGRTPEETAQIAKTTREAGIKSGTGFNYRWTPLVQHTRNLIQEGKLGDLTHYQGRFFSMYGSHPMGQFSWRFDSDLAGLGVLGDLMSHVVDLAHMMAGPVKRVCSQSHTFITERPLPVPGRGTHYSLGRLGDPMGEVDNEDYVGALVEFANGARGSFETSRTIFGPKCQFSFGVNGTKGAASWDFERMNEMQLYMPSDGDADDGYMRVLAGDNYPHHGNFVPGSGNGIGYEDLKVIEVYEFLQSIINDRQHTPSLEDALRVAEVNAAMVRSWRSGKWEEVTPLGSQ